MVKIAPETALKFTLNDSIRSIVAQDPDKVRLRERAISGGISGAIAQVGAQDAAEGRVWCGVVAFCVGMAGCAVAVPWRMVLTVPRRGAGPAAGGCGFTCLRV